jgi:hypothetical protein
MFAYQATMTVKYHSEGPKFGIGNFRFRAKFEAKLAAYFLLYRSQVQNCQRAHHTDSLEKRNIYKPCPEFDQFRR